MKLELKDEKGLLGTIELPVEELKIALGLDSASAKLADDLAHLQDESKAKDATIAELQDKVAHFESTEHEDEIIQKRVGTLTVENWQQIGEGRGWLRDLTEEERAELKEPDPAPEEEKPEDKEEGGVYLEGFRLTGFEKPEPKPEPVDTGGGVVIGGLKIV